MGLFDSIRSDVPLFSQAADRNLQTKSLEGLMFEYWISPDGELFQIDYSGTFDLHLVPEGERKHRLHVWDWKPNGNRGRVRFVPWEGTVIVYPARWTDNPTEWAQKVLHFTDGRLGSIDTTTRGLRKAW